MAADVAAGFRFRVRVLGLGGEEVGMVVVGSDVLSASLFLDDGLLSFLSCTRPRFITHINPSLNSSHELKRSRRTKRFPNDQRVTVWRLCDNRIHLSDFVATNRRHYLRMMLHAYFQTFWMLEAASVADKMHNTS